MIPRPPVRRKQIGPRRAAAGRELIAGAGDHVGRGSANFETGMSPNVSPRLRRATTRVEWRVGARFALGRRRPIMKTHIIALAAVLGLVVPVSAGELDREFKGGDRKAPVT